MIEDRRNEKKDSHEYSVGSLAGVEERQGLYEISYKNRERIRMDNTHKECKKR